MALLARYNGTVQDLTGNAIAAGDVFVYREGAAAIEQLFANRAGTVSKDNPVKTDTDGSFWFHVPGGAFRFIVTAPGQSREIRYVGIGIASESDVQGLTPKGLYSAVVTYEIGDMTRHGDFLFASRVDDNLANTPDSVTPADTTEWMYLGPIAGTTEADILAALGITGVIISEDPPSGGVDGNLWLQV